MPRFPFRRQRETVLELLVIEGRDAGSQFTVDGKDVPIGRGVLTTGKGGAVLLSDPTVSSQQAVIHMTRSGPVIEHRSGATNPTLVNGNSVERQPIAAGDRIQMGLVVLEVRSRQGHSLGNLNEERTENRPSAAYQPAMEDTTERRLTNTVEMTEVRRVGKPWGRLHLVRGVPGAEGREFKLQGEKVSLGRSPDCEVEVPESGVSRIHAQLIWQGEQLFLEHRSSTNPTYVNGLPVTERTELSGGEEIQLADSAVFRLEFQAREPAEAEPVDPERTMVRGTAPPKPPGPELPPTTPAENPGLITAIHQKIEREQDLRRELEESESDLKAAIDEKYGFTGTFLDIDVVDSYGMKARASRPDYIIVSFDRFREFARGVVEEFEGEVLNSNGDELMCFFESPHQACRAAQAVVVRLEEFNQKDNLLNCPFRVRQGAHTGRSLVDRKRGVAYSPILDVAGHLQKNADVGGLLISQQTLEELPEGLPFELAGELEREGIPTHRLTGSLD